MTFSWLRLIISKLAEAIIIGLNRNNEDNTDLIPAEHVADYVAGAETGK